MEEMMTAKYNVLCAATILVSGLIVGHAAQANQTHPAAMGHANDPTQADEFTVTGNNVCTVGVSVWWETPLITDSTWGNIDGVQHTVFDASSTGGSTLYSQTSAGVLYDWNTITRNNNLPYVAVPSGGSAFLSTKLDHPVDGTYACLYNVSIRVCTVGTTCNP